MTEKIQETLFENFLMYCAEDNEPLKIEIQTWLADYFDLSNRTIKIEEYEKKWITENLTPKTQILLFGYTLEQWEKEYNNRVDK